MYHPALNGDYTIQPAKRVYQPNIMSEILPMTPCCCPPSFSAPSCWLRTPQSAPGAVAAVGRAWAETGALLRKAEVEGTSVADLPMVGNPDEGGIMFGLLGEGSGGADEAATRGTSVSPNNEAWDGSYHQSQHKRASSLT